MKKRTILSIGIAMITLCFSCDLGLSGSGAEANSGRAAGSTDKIHIVGNSDDGTTSVACYWNGTRRTVLYNGKSDAYSVTVSGGTVYVAGCYYVLKNGNWFPVACAWVIGTGGVSRMYLPLPDNPSLLESGATSITVANGTVYTSGYYNLGRQVIPCYWVGSYKRVDLPPNGDYFINLPKSICVAATGTVYVGGVTNAGTQTACYWTSEPGGSMTRTDLPAPGEGFSGYNAIAVSRGTIYAAGGYRVDSNSTPAACLWTSRGSAVRRAALNGFCTGSIYLSGTVPYIAGNYKDGTNTDVACYWVRRTRVALTNGCMAYAVFPAGGTVYAAGITWNNKTQKINACYWAGRNNMIKLPDVSANNSTARAIYVVPGT